MTTLTDTWLADWQGWHAERTAAATAVDGLAAATGTHFLDDTARRIPGASGTWIARDGRVVSPDLGIDLGPGERVTLEARTVTAIARPGRVALRVLDPQAATRRGLIGIDTFDPDPAWILTGVVETGTRPLKLEHVDGFVSDNTGIRLRVRIEGREVRLWGVSAADGSIAITFSDTTVGVETQRYRFLTVAAPDEQARVELDFNRAYLPPSAFTEHYLCPLPPASNRLDTAVRAGETRIRYTDEQTA
ncbi:DUF1684 domain-containing protein [Nocardia alni]|uniref:DUF1684 domain-containing protein n=1 Tax=Nocardia alni TaxID=2815723 RepID=UPI001C23B332|nr:DUF1684 domain-containing protein [Nocardia alni]